MDRKLAAILAADVVGYSALMEADERAGVRACLSAAELKERPATLRLKSCDAERANAGTAPE